jgi:hypothetical protein
METLVQFAVLAVATFIATVAAIALTWLFLQTTFHLMQPARVREVRVMRPELVQGTRVVARQFALHR